MQQFTLSDQRCYQRLQTLFINLIFARWCANAVFSLGCCSNRPTIGKGFSETKNPIQLNAIPGLYIGDSVYPPVIPMRNWVEGRERD